jgi:predicted MPP superfamily phosphohydrolase
MLSIVQLSDLHFGPKHLDDKVRCLEEVLTFLQDWPADVAAIPGDIYAFRGRVIK